MSTVQHDQRAHAVLSPSAATRWMACTPSARFEEQFPDKDSEYAKEGTAAHELAELLIKKELGLIKKAAYEKQIKAIVAGPYYSWEMRGYCEDYAEYVIERLNAAKAVTPDAMLFLETKIDLSGIIPEGHGTRDVAIVAAGTLVIIDLKYGKGVPVSAENNKQLMLYAAGTLAEMDVLYGIDTVEMVIYQPRLDNISTYTMAAGDLRAWVDTEARPKAALAFAGEGDYQPGDHCKFCKGKATCKALADYCGDVVADFTDPNKLTDLQVSAALMDAKLVIDWIDSLKTYALEQALAGKKWPGFKLVEGRSNRKYGDEAAVIQALGGREDIYKPQELLGITAMEGLLGKKEFAELVGPFVVKPPGAPTLAPLSDKRPEYNSAINDFATPVTD